MSTTTPEGIGPTSIFAAATRFLRDLSLARKLTAISMIAGGVAMAMMAVTFVTYDIASSRQRLVRDLTMLADMVSASSAPALTSGDRNAASETLRTVAVNPHIVSVALLRRDGSTFARYDRDS